MQGLFITFEGIDGSGKTTQLKKIYDFLTSKGLDCVVTREPGAMEFGKKIRDILLNSGDFVSDKAEMFLFLADRAQHIQKLIKPALSEGKIVLCDRHVDSTIAYQGYGRKQDIDMLRELNNIATDGIKPDLTLLFDVSQENSLARMGKEKDRMESAGNAFFTDVKNGYIELQKSEPERIKLINANNSLEMVYNDTMNAVQQIINKKLGV